MKMGTRAGLALLATVWMASSAMAQNIEGTWQGRIGDDGDRSQIQMRVDSRGGYNSMSLSSSIVALLLDNFDRDGELAYRLERDAGSIQFVGSMRQDRVLGGFTFTAHEDPRLPHRSARSHRDPRARRAPSHPPPISPARGPPSTVRSMVATPWIRLPPSIPPRPSPTNVGYLYQTSCSTSRCRTSSTPEGPPPAVSRAR